MLGDTSGRRGKVMELSDADCCPVTGRVFEVGSGALPKEQQSANFVRERDRAAGLPKEGERCPKTGRLYECGSGAHRRAEQTASFVQANLPPTQEEKHHLEQMTAAATA